MIAKNDFYEILSIRLLLIMAGMMIVLLLGCKTTRSAEVVDKPGAMGISPPGSYNPTGPIGPIGPEGPMGPMGPIGQ